MTKFLYYNRNPYKIRMNDCVCRAISTATNLSYIAVDRLLSAVARRHKCPKLCVCCYEHLLSGEFKYKKYRCKNNETVSDIVKDFPNDILIIRIDGHLTSSINGKLYDTWDCYDRAVDCFWIIDRRRYESNQR